MSNADGRGFDSRRLHHQTKTCPGGPTFVCPPDTSVGSACDSSRPPTPRAVRRVRQFEVAGQEHRSSLGPNLRHRRQLHQPGKARTSRPPPVPHLQTSRAAPTVNSTRKRRPAGSDKARRCARVRSWSTRPHVKSSYDSTRLRDPIHRPPFFAVDRDGGERG